jgi:hypothetical protein
LLRLERKGDGEVVVDGNEDRIHHIVYPPPISFGGALLSPCLISHMAMGRGIEMSLEFRNTIGSLHPNAKISHCSLVITTMVCTISMKLNNQSLIAWYHE